jgi:hypothetical protein
MTTTNDAPAPGPTPAGGPEPDGEGFAELPPEALPSEDVAPAGDVHGPGGPEDYLPREADPPVPPPPPGIEAFGDVLVPGAGYINPPEFFGPESPATSEWDEHDHSGEHVHGPGCAHRHAPGKAIEPRAPKVGRNDPCPCGSGQKYKKCCGG